MIKFPSICGSGWVDEEKSWVKNDTPCSRAEQQSGFCSPVSEMGILQGFCFGLSKLDSSFRH